MSLSDVEAVAANLKAATNFTAVFGPLPKGDQKVQRAWVRRQFAFLAQTVHPDHVPESYILAETAFEDLRALFNAAEKAIQGGTYEQSFRAGYRPGAAPIADDFFELRTGGATYRCSNTPYRTGDFSVLYKGQVGDRDVLVKVASTPASNSLLEAEARRLKTFRETDRMKGIVRWLPEIIDSLLVPGPDKRQYRANVMAFAPAMLSLTDIMAAFPKGELPVPHAAWIVRRVVAQTSAAAMTGLVHGAITPDHVVVDPIRHEPLHIGWLHAVEPGRRITMVVDRWRDFYPPEVFEKRTPSHQTDIFMAGKVAIFLFGGDPKTNTLPSTIPDKVARQVLRCVEHQPSHRPEDGVQLLKDLTVAIREAWGRSYRPLLLPI